MSKDFNSTTPNGAKTETDVWITPKYLIDKIGLSTLDPCGWTPNGKPFVETAKNYFTEGDDGLNKEWFGDVFINFPYSQAKIWMEKANKYNNGIVLCFARTETKWFQDNLSNATGILFIKKRISFLNSEGKGGKPCNAPSILIAWGEENFKRIKQVDGIAVRIEK